MDEKVRHILGLSGGKDSAALAVFMRDKVPEMEYVFCDTQKELPETYEYLDRLQAFLGKPIVHLNADRGFDHYLELYGGYLPSSRMRWCTRKLKIKPFEDYVGNDIVYSYIGIRADENRDGYISSKPNIKPFYPFKEAGMREADIYQTLDDAGLGLPKYYEWRSRSGCYFCFFQRKAECAGLKEHHPELFEEAKRYEKFDQEKGVRYTWSQTESLEELESPGRLEEIKLRHEKALAGKQLEQKGSKLFQIFSETLDEEDDSEPCLVCSL